MSRLLFPTSIKCGQRFWRKCKRCHDILPAQAKREADATPFQAFTTEKTWRCGKVKRRKGWGWRWLIEGKTADSKFLPFFFCPCFSSCGKAFQIMMWIDVQQLSPLLGPVRHLTGHRWQHYDGLGIVIPDACHLFTSRPSLISHHRPYNLAGISPAPLPPLLPSLLPVTLYKTPYITTAFYFFPFFLFLHPRAEHSPHI